MSCHGQIRQTVPGIGTPVSMAGLRRVFHEVDINTALIRFKYRYIKVVATGIASNVW